VGVGAGTGAPLQFGVCADPYGIPPSVPLRAGSDASTRGHHHRPRSRAAVCALVPLGPIVREWILAERGQVVEGIAQPHQSLAAQRAIDAHPRSYGLALWAGAYGKVGQPEEGLRVLTEAQTAAQARGERFLKAELARLKGVLLLAQSSENQAAGEICFQQALDIARRREVKSLELRATMSLIRLWRHRGNRAGARALLAPIYGWFTEGFDTADLREAKALVEELERR
jgi:predicted ATPase